MPGSPFLGPPSWRHTGDPSREPFRQPFRGRGAVLAIHARLVPDTRVRRGDERVCASAAF